MPDYSVKQLSQFSTLLIANGGSGGEAFSLPNVLKLALIFFCKIRNNFFFRFPRPPSFWQSILLFVSAACA